MANNKKNANYVTDKTAVAKVEKNKIKRSRKVKKTTLNVVYIVVAVLAAILFVTGFVHIFKACSKTTPREFIDPSKGDFKVTDIVQLDFADYGKVIIELYGEEAPETVANFKKRVEEGYFTDKYLTISTSTSTKYVSFVTEKETDEHGHSADVEPGIKGEYYDNNFENKISHTYGVITMNRNGHGYNSSSTDFMIITDNSTYANEKTGFNGNNAAFGRVFPADMEKIEKMVSDYQGKSDEEKEEETDPNALSSGSNKIALTEADIELGYVERTFTPKYEGYYFFDTTEEELVSIIINDGESQALGTGDKAVQRYFEADKEYKLKINIKASSKAGDVKISINDRVLTAGSNTLDKITKDDITNSKVFYYTYTTPVTGEYIFTLTNIKGVKVVGKDGVAVADKDDKDETLTLDLVADVVYTFEVSAKEASITGTATSVVPKIEVKEQYFEIGVEEKIKFTEAQITAKKVVYTFVAGVSGKYSVSSTDIKEVTFLNLDGTELGKNYANLEAGKTYKLSMKTEGLTKETEYKLTIVEPKLVAGDNTIKLLESDVDAGKGVYSFTAEYTGKYTFSLSVNSKKDTLVFTVKDENGKIVNEYVEDGKNVVKPYAHLEADKEYTIELGIDYKETSGGKDVDKKLAKDTKYTLTIDDPELNASSNQNIVSSSTTEQTDGNTITITKNDSAKGPMTYVFNVEASGMYEIKIATDMKENIKLRIKSGDKVTEVTDYSHIRLNKGDVCEFETNFNFADSTSTQEKTTTITVYQTYPKIIGSVVADKIAK